MSLSEPIFRNALDLSNRLRGRYAKGPIMPNGEPEFGYTIFTKMPDGKPFPGLYVQAAEMIEALTARAEGVAYEPTDAEVREGESLDSVSYVIRRGETDETAFRRAARAEIVRLRRAISARAEGVAALQHGDRARMEKALREAERELAFAVEHMGRTGGGYERALVSVRQALGSGKEF